LRRKVVIPVVVIALDTSHRGAKVVSSSTIAQKTCRHVSMCSLSRRTFPTIRTIMGSILWHAEPGFGT
jgi:hypothetical protein